MADEPLPVIPELQAHIRAVLDAVRLFRDVARLARPLTEDEREWERELSE